MTKPTIRINDNGNIIDREMTNDEFAQYEKDLASARLMEAAAAEKAATKEAVLAKLGLTADEVAALLG